MDGQSGGPGPAAAADHRAASPPRSPRISLARRVASRAYAGYARRFRTPFAERSAHPLLVHCTHHKVGTVWFRSILVALCRHYGMPYCRGTSRPIDPAAGVVLFEDAGRWTPDNVGAREFRGSHIVRDPRDLVVSGYEYHLHTTEAWALRPDPRYDGLSYQEHLRGLSEHDGLLAEIDWQAGGPLRAMTTWEYGQPGFLELRLEDVVADEVGWFTRLFEWYGLSKGATAVGLAEVARTSLRHGGARTGHARGGVPGEWRNRLGPTHLRLLDERTEGLVHRLGYDAPPTR